MRLHAFLLNMTRCLYIIYTHVISFSTAPCDVKFLRHGVHCAFFYTILNSLLVLILPTQWFVYTTCWTFDTLCISHSVLNEDCLRAFFHTILNSLLVLILPTQWFVYTSSWTFDTPCISHSVLNEDCLKVGDVVTSKIILIERTCTPVGWLFV